MSVRCTVKVQRYGTLNAVMLPKYMMGYSLISTQDCHITFILV